MEDSFDIGIFILWLIAVIYAFMVWGFWHGLLNLIFPYSLAWDVITILF